MSNKLTALMQGIRNSKILHAYDLYNAALLDYEYSKYKARTGTSSYEQKVNEYKRFFSGCRPPAVPADDTIDTE